ncbi:MAG: alpha/beta hydrolase [Myxococcales bacterium]|nr:alpha/beta hydrolase [Myxococcales bacterium]
MTANALRPRRNAVMLLPSFFAAWLTTELALHHLALQLALAAVLIAHEALADWQGILGFALLAISWPGLVHIYWTAHRTDHNVREALAAAELDFAPGERRYPRTHLLVPPLMFWRRDVEVKRRVKYAEDGGQPLFLDIYRPRAPGERRPAIVQVHGGGWIIGFKEYQGIPLLTHMAAGGWVGFNVDYRLSPRATFPDHLIDIKRALAWIRANADELGVDPDFIVVTGGSAGGHLTALMALTAGDPEYQPGFEDADTSVQAAVVFYGVFDFANILGNKPTSFVRLLERVVMKKRLRDDPEAFLRASPLARVHEGAPPIFVIHGTRDNLASVQDAREFARRLRETSHDLVLYAELPGAAHAFDVFPSTRTVAVIEAVERFLVRLHHAHLRGSRARRPQG